MNDAGISERLAALAKGANRSFAARFRDVYDDIQAAIDAGVSRAQARDELAASGIDMPQNTFNSLLVRVRKERSKIKVSDVDVSGNTARHIVSALPTTSSTSTNSQRDNANLLIRRDEIELPEDWRTAELPPEVSRSLTPTQKAERTKARDKMYHPSPYDALVDGKL
jgi:hypothetical protein